MCKKAKIGLFTALIPIAVVVAIVVFRISPVYIIVVSVAVALIWAAVKNKR